MKQELLSVGIDIGTTTTQIIFSRLTVKNTASNFAAPNFSITHKQVIYRSAIHFTPLISDCEIDLEKLKEIVNSAYIDGEIDPKYVDTGAVIITGETARKDNAQAVLSALAGFAGDFVVATAGPDLESVLAGKGGHCDRYSKTIHRPVLNIDMGGGTSNFCLFEKGAVTETGCLNIGGRLLKLDKSGAILYKSPVISQFLKQSTGEHITPTDLAPLIQILVETLEEAVGLRPKSQYFGHFLTEKTSWAPPKAPPVLSFSGGVADTIYCDTPLHWLAYGDMGVLLGQAIRNSKLMDLPHYRPSETIGATVVGAGCHSTTLSGSTICISQIDFPLKNLPVLHIEENFAELPAEMLKNTISNQLKWFWENQEPTPIVLSLKGENSPSFSQIQKLAQSITDGLAPLQAAKLPLILCVAKDVGKALGQAILSKFPHQPLISMDGLSLSPGSYLDIGKPIGTALPVVIKTLVFTSK